MTNPLISIVIPTYKRPDSLKRLLVSIMADLEDRTDTVIIVADNDKNQSAKDTVNGVSKACSRPIIYTVAAEPGVSNARNAGIAQVKSRYVLFLDDDMEVVLPYLAPLLSTSLSLQTTITFASIVAALPSGQEKWKTWLSPLFSRSMEGSSRVISEVFGTGGCLIDLQGIELPSPAFDPALNEVGGEDDAFFAHIINQCGTMGWCAEALAREHVPIHRTTLKYLWNRHFAFGQTPARMAADRGLSGLPAILKWMLVGGAQTIIHGAGFLFLRLLGRPAYVGQLGRMAQGVGKIFWWDGLSPRFYGANAR